MIGKVGKIILTGLFAVMPLWNLFAQGIVARADSMIQADVRADSTVGLLAKFTEVDHFFQKVVQWEGFDLWRLIIFGVGFLLALIMMRVGTWILKRLIKGLLAHADNKIGMAFCDAVAPPVSLALFTVILYFSGAAITHVNHDVFTVYWSFFAAFFCAIAAWFFYRLSDMTCNIIIISAAKKGKAVNEVLLMLLRSSLKVIILGMSILFIGDQFGIKITTLLAGAGVMGLAVAFAAQDTIANVFGSVMVILDKPFTVGDFIKFDGNEGTVTAIGFRSTRLKTVDGYIITVPNKTAAGANITNVTLRRYMRQVIDIGLTYDTPPEKMKQAEEILHDIVHTLPGFCVDQPCHTAFFSFGSYAMNIRLIAFYHTLDHDGVPGPIDYWQYYEWVNQLNMAILTRFNAEKLSFAYPTQVTYHAPLNPVQDEAGVCGGAFGKID